MALTKVQAGLLEATGTASSSTFLRGDGAWAAPAVASAQSSDASGVLNVVRGVIPVLQVVALYNCNTGSKVPLPVTLTVWLVAVAVNLNQTSRAVPIKLHDENDCDANTASPAVVLVQVVLPGALAVSVNAPQISSFAGGVETHVVKVVLEGTVDDA